jgi:hypothetical protein
MHVGPRVLSGQALVNGREPTRAASYPQQDADGNSYDSSSENFHDHGTLLLWAYINAT